ncbi:MAG: hypothetical protein V3U89_01845 [Methylophilaceae bacterium]
MGITPIVFSPPPANGVNIGRCLAKADWNGLNLDTCNFSVDEMTNDRIYANKLLEIIEKTNRVVHVDNLHLRYITL